VPAECQEFFKRPMLKENSAYVITCFRAFENFGFSRPTHHSYRIEFLPSTRVYLIDNYYIPPYGLTLFTSKQIRRRIFGYRYLVGKFFDFVLPFNIFDLDCPLVVLG
jgi:hypothetical protein